MFSAVQEIVRFGVSNYRKKLDEMSSAINKLIVKYQTEGVITMPYTIEDFRNEIKENFLETLTTDDVVNRFPAEEIFKKFSTDERLKGLSAEQIIKELSPEKFEAYLKKMKKQKTKRE